MSGRTRTLSYLLTLAAVVLVLVTPAMTTEIRAAFYDNAAGRQPYKKRLTAPSLHDILRPPERDDFSVEDLASLILQDPPLASRIVEQFLDTNKNGRLTADEIMELGK